MFGARIVHRAIGIFLLSCSLGLAQSGGNTCEDVDDLKTITPGGGTTALALSGTTNDFGIPNLAQCPLACNDWGTGNDVIYTFQVSVAGIWEFEFCEPNGVFFEGSMQLRSGGACPGDTCLGADDGGCTGCSANPVGPGVSLTANMTTGTQYYLIVDAKNLFVKGLPGEGGIFNIAWDVVGGCGDGQLDPGEQCEPPNVDGCDANCMFIAGDDCSNGISIDLQKNLPFSETGQTTCLRGNTYEGGTCISAIPCGLETCDYTDGEDIIYELTTSEDICVNIAMTADDEGKDEMDAWIGMALDDSCPPALNCTAGSVSGGTPTPLPLENIELSAGTHYLMIDTNAPPVCISSFELSITACPTSGACCVGEVCTDDIEQTSCDGRSFPGSTCEDVEFCPPANDLCADAIQVTEEVVPFDTTGATPDDVAPEACTFPLLNEVWYQYTAAESGLVVIDTCGTDNEGPDTVLEVYTGCNCEQLEGNSLACNDDTEGCGLGGQGSLAAISVQAGSCYTIRMSGWFDLYEAGELSIQSGDCTVLADCADTDSDGIRDDGCVWYECANFLCNGVDVVFADMGGQFGACAPDGTADGNDRFQALNCFANINPEDGGPYACEESPPSALNVDAGGQFGSCSPDGVCDGNDAFAALNAFGDVTTCSCPLGGPAPVVGADPVTVAVARVSLQATQRVVSPGDVIDVDVYLDNALPDLRGYQLHMGANGGRSGTVDLIDIAIRQDTVLSDVAEGYWTAFNRTTRQMLVGIDQLGQPVNGGYLATFSYRVSADASGRFVIDVLHDHDDPAQRTYFFPTPQGERVAVKSAPLGVSVKTRR